MTEELMIGNWITTDKGYLIEVDHLKENGVVSSYNTGGYGDGGWMDYYENIRPIPLSEDILTKMGFTKHRNSHEFWTFWMLPNKWYISEAHHTEPSAGVETGKFYRGDDYTEIKSLHHLQNYYYITTGLKLNINL